MPHPKWDERAIISWRWCKSPAPVTREALLAFYEGKTAKWQIPDDVVFVDAIPWVPPARCKNQVARNCSKITGSQRFGAIRGLQ